MLCYALQTQWDISLLWVLYIDSFLDLRISSFIENIVFNIKTIALFLILTALSRQAFIDKFY